MFKFKKIALAASIFTATALSLAAFAACGEPVKGDKGDKGDKGETGATGATGAAGQDGKDGVGIEDIKPGEDGKLIITMTDGTKKEVAMPTVDAPVAEEHNLAKEPITIIAANGSAGTLAPGQAGIGLYVCTDCGDVYAKTTHEHNFEAWKPVNTTTPAANVSWTRDCYLTEGTSPAKVDGETQSIDMIKYTDVVSNGKVAEGWTKINSSNKATYSDVLSSAFATYNTQTAYVKEDTQHDGLWVVIEKTPASCNTAGEAVIQYFQFGKTVVDNNGTENDSSDDVTYVLTHSGNKLAIRVGTKYCYKTVITAEYFSTKADYAADNASSNTAADTMAKIPQTDHFFDMTTGVLVWNAQVAKAKADANAQEGYNVNALTYDEYLKVVDADPDAQKQGDSGAVAGFADGFDTAYYLVVCANCNLEATAAGSATNHTAKVNTYAAVVTSETTQIANCAQDTEAKKTASYSIAVGNKTLTKVKETEAVWTAKATTKDSSHIYNVYADKTGSVIGYYYAGNYYKSLAYAQALANGTSTTGLDNSPADLTQNYTFYRLEQDGAVVAVTCANCSTGRVAYNVPKAVFDTTDTEWEMVQNNIDPTVPAEADRFVNYKVDFAIDGAATDKDVFTTANIKIPGTGHVEALYLGGNKVTAIAAGDINTWKAYKNQPVDIKCSNYDGQQDGDNKTFALNTVLNSYAGSDAALAGVTVNTVVITGVTESVKSEADCENKKVVTLTVTVEVREQALDKDGVPVYNAAGVPQYTVKETKTFTYDVEVGDAKGHKNVETILVVPTASNPGLVEDKCSVCGKVANVYVLPALNASYSGNDADDKEATCLTGAYTVYTYNRYLTYTGTDAAKDTLSLDGKPIRVTGNYVVVEDGSFTALKTAGKSESYKDGVNGKAYTTTTKTFETAKGEALGHEMGAWKAAEGSNSNYKWIRYCERVNGNGIGIDGYFEVSNADSNPDAE